MMPGLWQLLLKVMLLVYWVNLVASPTPDVASSFEQGFNPANLTAQYSNALPGFSAVAGPTKIIAGLDRHSTKINTKSTIDLIANDIFLGDGTVSNIISLSTDATDFTSNLQSLTLSGGDAIDDISLLRRKFLNVEALSGGAAGRYNLYYKIESDVTSDGQAVGAVVIDILPTPPVINIASTSLDGGKESAGILANQINLSTFFYTYLIQTISLPTSSDPALQSYDKAVLNCIWLTQMLLSFLLLVLWGTLLV